jgi:hypothetical protein
MYLQFFSLSDVTDIAGHHIEAWVIKGNEMTRGVVSGTGQYISNLQRRHGRYGTRRSEKHSHKRSISHTIWGNGMMREDTNTQNGI